MTAAWIDFFIMLGVFALIAIASLIWVVYFRKRGRKHRRKHRHPREQRATNPTLAETGGLPPTRQSESPGGTPSQTP